MKLDAATTAKLLGGTPEGGGYLCSGTVKGRGKGRSERVNSCWLIILASWRVRAISSDTRHSDRVLPDWPRRCRDCSAPSNTIVVSGRKGLLAGTDRHFQQRNTSTLGPHSASLCQDRSLGRLSRGEIWFGKSARGEVVFLTRFL